MRRVIKVVGFWDTSLCTLVNRFQHFKELVPSSGQKKMKVAGSLETRVPISQITRRNTPYRQIIALIKMRTWNLVCKEILDINERGRIQSNCERVRYKTTANLSRRILEKSIFVELLKNFLAISETKKIITVFDDGYNIIRHFLMIICNITIQPTSVYPKWYPPVTFPNKIV